MNMTTVMVAACAVLLLACREKEPAVKNAVPEVTATPDVHSTNDPAPVPKPAANPPLEESAPVAENQPKTEAADEAPKPPATPIVGTTRIVLLIEHEALRSETRLLDKFRAQLTKGKKSDDSPTSDEEKNHYAALLAGSNTLLPANWASIETVFVVGVASPASARNGKSVSEGFTGFAMYKPPQLEPILAELGPVKTEKSTDEFIRLVKAISKESMNDK